MKCDADFKREVLNCCYESLEELGFRRIRKENVDWPIAPSFNAWVGLNTTLHADHIAINPFVGVHASELETMWFRLSGRNYPGRYGPSATYAVHLGELERAKNEIVFRFEAHLSSEEIKSEAKRLALLIHNVGLDYSRSISSYSSLLPLLREKVPMLGGYPERVSCCLYLMGLQNEARAFVEEFSREKSASFDCFAGPFLDLPEMKTG